MSIAEDQPIACPACANASSFRIQRSVDGDDAALVAMLLDGTLFAFACRACGHRARVVHPELCYVDRAHDVVVQLDATGTFDAKAVAAVTRALPRTTRLVRDGNALLEKVKIARAGLDDRVVEALKLVARGSLGPQAEGRRILFEALDGEGDGARVRFTLLGRDGTAAGLSVPRASYDRLLADLASHGRILDPGSWAVVDETIALAMLAP